MTRIRESIANDRSLLFRYGLLSFALQQQEGYSVPLQGRRVVPLTVFDEVHANVGGQSMRAEVIEFEPDLASQEANIRTAPEILQRGSDDEIMRLYGDWEAGLLLRDEDCDAVIAATADRSSRLYLLIEPDFEVY